MKKHPLWLALATTAQRIRNLTDKPGREDVLSYVEGLFDRLVKEHLPSGSGFDGETSVDISQFPQQLVVTTDFHLMDQHGFYSGWYTVRIGVAADWGGFDVPFTEVVRSPADAEDVAGDVDYIVEAVIHALNNEVEYAPV